MARARSQFLRFCLVGATGYVVNLIAYWALITAGLHYLAAAAISFVVAAVNNFLLNRSWTFAARTDRWLGQCLRALLVSCVALGLNQIFLLTLVGVGSGHLVGQATAIVLVTPFSFAANRLWAFSGRHQDKARARLLANG